MKSDLKIIELTEETIKNKIYIIRGQKVMLDFELAEIYEKRILIDKLRIIILSFHKILYFKLLAENENKFCGAKIAQQIRWLLKKNFKNSRGRKNRPRQFAISLIKVKEQPYLMHS